jgi:hypothetical protein
MSSPKPAQFPFARQSAGPSPLRRPNSLRRTTSIDSAWPNGYGQPWEMNGQARDVLTTDEGELRVLATGHFRIKTSPAREILSIATDPRDDRIAQLVGIRAGGASRAAIAEILGDLRGSPLFQLLDDFAGASLVAGWIWSRWTSDWLTRAPRIGAPGSAGRAGRMVDICAGFAAGSSALRPDGAPDHVSQSSAAVGPLEHPDDPGGWHAMPAQTGQQMRRARRIDAWLHAGSVFVDAGFQDSGSNPGGGRTAVHEYRVHAEIDAETGVLTALEAQPLVLPYRECPGAAANVTRLIGARVSGLRMAVLETLPSTLGCTHLNDVLRALADVPDLVKALNKR